jgi:hypothetical protein
LVNLQYVEKLIPKQNNRGSSRGRGKRQGNRRNSNFRLGVDNNSIQRPLINRREHIYDCVLSANLGKFDMSAPPVLNSFYVTLNSFSDAGNFIATFDQFRIQEVSYTFYPLIVDNFILAGTVATVVPTSIYNVNVITTAVDQDDITAPPSEASVLNHDSSISHGPFVKPVTRTYVPMVAASVYQTGGFGGYSAKANQWLDVSSPNTQHYGIKYAIANGSTTTTNLVNYAVYVKAKLQFRKHL